MFLARPIAVQRSANEGDDSMFRQTLFLAIIAANFLGAGPAKAEPRLALVIGQSAYRSVPALLNPTNDAKAVSEALTDAGFEVSTASNLSQNQMREAILSFAGRVVSKGPDSVALVFYAGHGVQIDGENYLVPIDVEPKREADIPIQAVRLNDVLNALTSIPNRMRIVLLDACRNDPFPEISKTAGHGLAIVDTKIGTPGTFVSFSTSPGAESDDGDGPHSPYTTALLPALKERGISIEETFKHVRVAVNKATGGRQTPWDSSSLTEDFEFVSDADHHPVAMPPQTKRTVEKWRQELQDKTAEAANELMVADGTDESYEAFVGLYAQSSFGPHAREWLDRHRRMVAWNKAVFANTDAGYRTFLAQYPDSDLTLTARKLDERRESTAAGPTASTSSPTNTAIAPVATPQSGAAPGAVKKTDTPAKKPKRPERQVAPRYGGGGSYGGGDIRSGY
jgi:uncharacterized caspase-like protein